MIFFKEGSKFCHFAKKPFYLFNDTILLCPLGLVIYDTFSIYLTFCHYTLFLPKSVSLYSIYFEFLTLYLVFFGKDAIHCFVKNSKWASQFKPIGDFGFNTHQQPSFMLLRILISKLIMRNWFHSFKFWLKRKKIRDVPLLYH